MKKINLYILSLLLLAGCEKNTFNATERSGVEGKALVKIGLFNMTSAARFVYIYNNGERISNSIASPYPYPGSGYNTNGSNTAAGDYFAVNPGTNKFELYTSNPGTASLISKIFETDQTFEADKKYTVFIADTAANTVAIKALDNGIAPADSGFVNIRLVNLIPNAPAIDFYRNSGLIKANVQYKEYTDFFNIPSGTADSFAFRIAGTAPGSAATATAFTRVALNSNRRILTIVGRGFIGTTDVRKPNVSVVVNQ